MDMPSSRDRALGRGVFALIPQADSVSATHRAAASLAALRTVPVHVGVLQAAVVLLEEAERVDQDAARAATTATTVELLKAAIAQAAEDG
ncbi:hypothetical protein [Streptomyces sp. NRRL B-1347]|uniref:hypothetical protein n=1 Tax=Streptomyces sp. NRRL B-1347 TaxID=1476877 RepID=UPI0004C64EEB|nr:hypothetical protein [Streptomyces sp. NRRL B-1347]